MDIIYEGIARAAGVVKIYVRAASPGGSPTGRAVAVTAADGLKNYECGTYPQLPL